MSDIAYRSSAWALAAALRAVARCGGPGFTGTGVVVCTTLEGLPYHAMADGDPIDPRATLPRNLLTLSHVASPFHDGFHLLARDLSFLRVACYLSPPIRRPVPGASLAGRGSRYSTAYFTSLLPQVECVGVVGARREVAVFQRGSVVDALLCEYLVT